MYGYIIPLTNKHAITEDGDVYNYSTLQRIKRHSKYNDSIYIQFKVRKINDLLTEALKYNKIVELHRTVNIIQKKDIDEFYNNRMKNIKFN